MKTYITTSTAAILALSVAIPANAEISERTIRIANGIAEDHPVGDGVAAMTECINEATDNAWTINAFWSSALGDDLQSAQSLRSGTLEMVVSSTSPLVAIEPALGVFDLPFLISDEAEADALLDGEFGQYMADMMPEHNLINLAYWENGFRNLSNSLRPVASLEDFTGMRVRVMQNNIFLDTFQTLGANATPMAFGEVFTALETGAIDAQENPYVTIDTSRFYEVQDYVSNTRHAYTPFMVLFSKPIFDRYSEQEQQILLDCAIVGRDVQRDASRSLSDESLQRIMEAGLEVNDISEDAMAQIREAVAGVYDRSADSIGADVIERVMTELAEIRGQ
ncbi:DctP family TRAP transporter solute-binding subunit [Yoonia sp.]|uniref:DctP family TRAP transporter solute-binding subunit n=1 Tax=Yoonia sp. TaxID=2212373 RepID=UPI00391DE6FE